jgi:hypothetical protein
MSSNPKINLISNFKNYFRLDGKNKIFSIAILIKRFNEKWYKDRKFRFKVVFGLIGICIKFFYISWISKYFILK